jgi:hypothetical protein
MNHPTNSRSTNAWTTAVLRIGGLTGVAVFAAALVLHFIGLAPEAATVAWIGVLVVIATAPLALLATAAETFRADRTTALLAVAVLVVLGAATVVALLLR